MEVTYTKKMQVTEDIKFLRIKAGVRYWENATVNGVEDTEGELIPFKVGDNWCVTIDVDRGCICDWPQGVTAKVHYKVCDCGSYFLENDDLDTVLSIEENYVPKIACPKENGYGDYIIMDIDENGKIGNWNNDSEILLNGFVETDDDW